MRNELPCPKIGRGQKHLTPEQADYMRHFTHERIAAMLSVAPSDEAAAEAQAEEHLRAAYRVAGLEPVPVRWFDSPLSFLQVPRISVGDNVEDLVGDGDGNLVGKNVEGKVWFSVWAHMGVVREHVEPVGDVVWASLANSWGDNMDILAWEHIRTLLGESVQAYQNESGLSFYRFFHEMFEPNELIHLGQFNELVCGYRLGSTGAWVVRKPTHLERDKQGRLHSETGMCAQWRDGWGLYAWHGVRCSERVILHPETLTRQDWQKERSPELRCFIQERVRLRKEREHR